MYNIIDIINIFFVSVCKMISKLLIHIILKSALNIVSIETYFNFKPVTVQFIDQSIRILRFFSRYVNHLNSYN